MLLYVIGAIIMGTYFYRLARAYHQNTTTWAVVGTVSFLAGVFVWFLLLQLFVAALLVSIIPSILAVAYIIVITSFLAGIVASLWARNIMVRNLKPASTTATL